MKLIYEKENKQQFSALLKFYWANFLRGTIFAAVLVAALLAVSFFFSLKTIVGKFFGNLFSLYLFMMMLFVLKHTSLLKYRTIRVIWTAPVPKSIFSKIFLYPALAYHLLCWTASFLLMYYNLYPLLTGLLIHIFLLHIFILNNWLPFQLVPLNPQDAPEKAE